MYKLYNKDSMQGRRTLTLLLAISSLRLLGQTISEPIKNANTIIIETKLTANEAFTKWGRHLAQNGYGIEKSDNTFYTLTTAPKDTKKFNYDFIINSVTTDSGTVISKIKWRLKSSIITRTNTTQFYDWEYSTGKNNVKGIIFEDVIETIKSFGPYIVRFEKR